MIKIRNGEEETPMPDKGPKEMYLFISFKTLSKVQIKTQKYVQLIFK
jgi:hypothetical protein